jgi:hypothetical protein
MRAEKQIILPRSPAPKTKRLGGGPQVPINTFNYVTHQQQQIAITEGLKRCSLATLLNRLANANLDLVALTRIKPKKRFAVIG